MAVGPDGTAGGDEVAALPGEEGGMARGLEAAIDRGLQRHPRGQAFVFGIHQELSPPVLEQLRRRYLAAGWPEVTVREGATGAHLLVLSPHPPA